MQIDSYYSGGVLSTFMMRIENTYTNLIHTNEKIQKWVNKVGEDNIDLGIKRYTMTNYIREQINQHKGHITYKYINSELSHLNRLEIDSPFSFSTLLILENDNLLHVKGGDLCVRIPTIARDICTYLHDLDCLWKQYEWLLKHEIGHLIHHIENSDGISIAEKQEIENDNYEEYKKFDQWSMEYKKSPGYNSDTVNKRYYNIPGEACANEAIGIDVDDLLLIDHEYKEKFKDKKICVEINIKEIKDYEKDVEKG